MQAIFFARGPFADRLRDGLAHTNATKVKGWKSIDPPILERELPLPSPFFQDDTPRPASEGSLGRALHS